MKQNRLITIFTSSVLLTLSLWIPTIQASEEVTAVIHHWQNSPPIPIDSPCPGDYYSEVIDFYCTAQAYLDYQKLSAISGLPVFVQSPHAMELELNNPYGFGHYNDEFIKWLRENILTAAQTPAFKELFKFFYHNYVKLSARAYYVVHQRLFANPKYLATEQQSYLILLKTQGIPEGYGYEYYHFAGLYDEGFDGTIVKEAVLFWIRRVTDGTEKEFFLGLKSLLEVYDTDFLAQLAEQTECQSTECQRLTSEKEMLTAEIELEMVYRKLYAKLAAPAQQKLEQAQQTWYQFRDSHLAFLLDSVDESKKSITEFQQKAKITQERIKLLESQLGY